MLTSFSANILFFGKFDCLMIFPRKSIDCPFFDKIDGLNIFSTTSIDRQIFRQKSIIWQIFEINQFTLKLSRLFIDWLTIYGFNWQIFKWIQLTKFIKKIDQKFFKKFGWLTNYSIKLINWQFSKNNRLTVKFFMKIDWRTFFSDQIDFLQFFIGFFEKIVRRMIFPTELNWRTNFQQKIDWLINFQNKIDWLTSERWTDWQIVRENRLTDKFFDKNRWLTSLNKNRFNEKIFY